LRWFRGVTLVVVVPGAMFHSRVRFNDAYPFLYTPDMAAVWLEAA